MGTVGRLGHLMLEVGKVVKGWAGNLVGAGWELLCDVSVCKRQQSVTTRM